MKGSLARLIVELALATSIAPAAWEAEEPETIMTAIDILNQKAE